MKRTTLVEYSQREAAALLRCREARSAKAVADRALDEAICAAVRLGLPVRAVGDAAGCSGANVSRLTTGHYAR